MGRLAASCGSEAMRFGHRKDSSFGRGFWVHHAGGTTNAIAEGDTIEVAPGDAREVIQVGLMQPTNNEDGRQSRFNDRGQLAFTA